LSSVRTKYYGSKEPLLPKKQEEGNPKRLLVANPTEHVAKFEHLEKKRLLDRIDFFPRVNVLFIVLRIKTLASEVEVHFT
jgi:hypothetical protein